MRQLITFHVNTERTWRGGEQLTLNVLDGLKERGHVTHVLAQPKSPMAQRAREHGHTTFEYPMRNEADVFAMWYIRSLLRKTRYDICHLHTPHAHTLGGVPAAFGRHRPIRVTNKRTDFSIYRNSFFGLNKYKYNYLTDCIIAESKKIREVLLNDGIMEHLLYLVYEGIDPRRFDGGTAAPLRKEFDLAPDQPVVGNIAHFADHKGQIYFIEAIPKVLKEFPDTRFFLVGQGELRESLMAKAKELGIEKETIFPGFRTDVPNFFKLFNVFVMSSVQEGLCTSILDAHVCETPVVGTTAGGIPEVVQDGETGRVVPLANSQALAQGIIDQLKAPKRAKEMARAGREMVLTKFSTENMVEETLDLYYQLLQNRA